MAIHSGQIVQNKSVASSIARHEIAFSKLWDRDVAVSRAERDYDPSEIAVMDVASAAILAAGHAKKNSGECQ